MITAPPRVHVYEVTVVAAGRIETMIVEAAHERSAKRQALRTCPWADGRRHFVGLRARRLDHDCHDRGRRA